jgi:lipoyl-dependent peroxiredoxin
MAGFRHSRGGLAGLFSSATNEGDELMPVRNAEATWEGDLKSGKGNMKLGSGAFQGNYSFATRFESAPGTNPEELIGAAHAGCFSMALSFMLSQAGYKPERVHTTAKVTIDKVGDGFKITGIRLETEGKIPGIDDRTFGEYAAKAKAGCPVSQALAATPIELNARLLK